MDLIIFFWWRTGPYTAIWPEVTWVVYGDGQISISGGATGSDVSHVTGNDVSHVTGSDVGHRNRKYVLRMRNQKLRYIRTSEALLTGSDKVKWPEAVLTGNMFCACPAFCPRFPWVCACGNGCCATSVVTEGHVTPLEVSLGCSLRRPGPITIGNPASYI